jgi:hypothetical protein
MDANYLVLGSEALPYVFIKGLQKQRDDLVVSTPKPARVDLSDWAKKAKDDAVIAMKNFAYSTVDWVKMFPDILGYKVKESFHASVLNGTAIEPFLFLQYVDLLKTAMEDLLSQVSIDQYNSKFQDIDNNIAIWNQKILRKFSPSLINVDAQFPIERIGFDSTGKPYDKWLTDALKAKPIFFDDPAYVDKLILFYNTVYLPQAN